MNKRILIDATFQDETRVAVVAKNKIEDYDFEISGIQQNRGNTYLAKITRVEPSLQAAFVEFGEGRHGFLPFSAIHPDYYQVPKEDREQLLREAEEEERERRNAELDSEDFVEDSEFEPDTMSELPTDGESKAADSPVASNLDTEPVEVIETTEVSVENQSNAYTSNVESGEKQESEPEFYPEITEYDESFMFETKPKPKRRPPIHKRYQIQEVIKVDQVVLVQVLKEPRGNKGATLTTYISLVGKYSILMPNSTRGGGVSRKIVNAGERKRLRKILKDLDTPSGLIIRTASATSADDDIIRDYDYLVNLWNNIRERTLSSTAPCLVHKEGDILQRAMRDLNDQSVDEILVDGDVAYKEVKALSEILTPDRVNIVKKWEKRSPVFVAHGIENQLDRLHLPTVQMKSGGYLVINHTEALVSIDVNSGRSTKERSVEKTALQTNLEAAEEACRQMRLRDLAGIIIIDFIDMYDTRNRRAIEKRVRDCLRLDRARVHMYRISALGLMEISRQRRRADITQVISVPCNHCQGTGHILSPELAALQVFRAVESRIRKSNIEMIDTEVPTELALYLLNEKRRVIGELEDSTGTEIRITATNGLKMGEYRISKSRARSRVTASRGDDQDDNNDNTESKSKQSEESRKTDSLPDEEVQVEEEEQAKPKKRNRKKQRKKKNKTRDENEVTAEDDSSIDSKIEVNPLEGNESEADTAKTDSTDENKVDEPTIDIPIDIPIEISNPDLLSEIEKNSDSAPDSEENHENAEISQSDENEITTDAESAEQHEPSTTEPEEKPKKKRRGWWNR